MRDVAARAQVSFKTVSRVVNEEGGVSPLLERRVRQAIEDLDFRPNAGARILRRSDHRTATIGLLLEDVANPFSAAVQRAVEDVAVPRGVFVLSASLDEDAARERALCKQFGARHVDGLVLAPAGDDQSHLAGELRRGTAIVCVDRAAGNLPVDSVLATNDVGAAEGVRHLAAAGHRRIAYLGDRRTIPTAVQRLAGYHDALAARGIAVDPALVVQDIRDAGGSDGAVTALLSRPDPPTALFTAQNMITIGAVRAHAPPRPRAPGGAGRLRRLPAGRAALARASRWWRRTRRRWAARPRSCCSTGSAAAPVRPRCGWCRPP